MASADTGILLKPYLNLNRGTARERWMRAGWLLKNLGRVESLERLCAISHRVSANSWPVGLAFDILPNGEPGRMKIYFRSGAVGPDWLAKWHEATGYRAHAAKLRACLDLFPWTGSKTYPDGAFTLSLEFHPDGTVSLKTDLAVTKWIANDGQSLTACEVLIERIGADPAGLKSAMAAIGAPPIGNASGDVMRFAGLGLEPDGSCHVNVYIAPPCGPTRTAARRGTVHTSTRDAKEKALSFLLAARTNGHWRDFRLSTGKSGAWVTAYVLAHLDKMKEVEESLDWLLNKRTPGGGWGYNAGVENDCNSTSWAIIALRRHGRKVPPEAFDVLHRCERSDGFTTYPKIVHRAMPGRRACRMLRLLRIARWSGQLQSRTRRLSGAGCFLMVQFRLIGG